jgi:hypothetical protein
LPSAEWSGCPFVRRTRKLLDFLTRHLPHRRPVKTTAGVTLGTLLAL